MTSRLWLGILWACSDHGLLQVIYPHGMKQHDCKIQGVPILDAHSARFVHNSAISVTAGMINISGAWSRGCSSIEEVEINCQGSCPSNECACTNGVAATGHSCTSDGSVICTSCNAGYHTDGSDCVENTCVCPGGTATTGSECSSVSSTHTGTGNAISCASCDAGHFMDGNECVQSREGECTNSAICSRNPTCPEMHCKLVSGLPPPDATPVTGATSVPGDFTDAAQTKATFDAITETQEWFFSFWMRRKPGSGTDTQKTSTDTQPTDPYCACTTNTLFWQLSTDKFRVYYTGCGGASGHGVLPDLWYFVSFGMLTLVQALP